MKKCQQKEEYAYWLLIMNHKKLKAFLHTKIKYRQNSVNIRQYRFDAKCGYG